MLPPVYKLLFHVQQQALLNSIMPSLRAVTCEINVSCNVFERNVEYVVCFFYDGEVTEELFDVANLAMTDIDIGLAYSANEQIVRLDFPSKIPQRGHFAFLRQEPELPRIRKENRTFLLQENDPIVVLLLDVQEALLGKVTPPLRHVSVGIDVEEKVLIFHYIYDGEISEGDRALAMEAINESRGTFPHYCVDSFIERVDFPNKMSHQGSRTAYWRRELKY